jgi:hypothetical protein
MIDGDDMSSPSSSRAQPIATASREAFVEQEFYAGRDLRLANAKALRALSTSQSDSRPHHD